MIKFSDGDMTGTLKDGELHLENPNEVQELMVRFEFENMPYGPAYGDFESAFAARLKELQLEVDYTPEEQPEGVIF